eukprot:64752-Chlamydomonas_euryale.AAC.6
MRAPPTSQQVSDIQRGRPDCVCWRVKREACPCSAHVLLQEAHGAASAAPRPTLAATSHAASR